MIIPKENERSVADFALLSSPAQFSRIQILSASTFEEVALAARSDRDDDLGEALRLFEQVHHAISDNPHLAETRRDPAIAVKLQKVISRAPNHVSAKLLHQRLLGNATAVFTLAKSIDLLSNQVVPGIRAANTLLETEKRDPRRAVVEKKALGAVRELQSKCDPRVRELAMAMESYLDYSCRIETLHYLTPNFRELENRRARLLRIAERLGKNPATQISVQ